MSLSRRKEKDTSLRQMDQEANLGDDREVLSEDEQPPEKRKEEYEDSNLVELSRSDIDRFVRDPPEPKVWGDLHWATPTAKDDSPMH